MTVFKRPIIASAPAESAPAIILFALLAGMSSASLVAQERPLPDELADAPATNEDVVSYDAGFFSRYRPNTALDMVLRLPGFLLDDGEDKRGLGAAAGNILVDDRYPSAKQEKPSELLERIPANQVERIDVIRNQARGIDMRGEAIVASIILREEMPVAGRWDVAVRKNFETRPVTVRSAVSVSDRWHSIEYNAGLVHRRFRSAESGIKDAFSPDGDLVKALDQDSYLEGDEGNLNLTLLSWLGESLVSLNMQYAFEDRIEHFQTIAADRGGDSANDDFFVDDDDNYDVEFGGDLERRIGDRLLAKAILLHTFSSTVREATQQSYDVAGNPDLFRLADSDVEETESVGRFELYWARSSEQSFIFSLEGARNVIEGKLAQLVDDGSGPVDVPVPGGNTRVQENRFDILLSGTSYFDSFEINYGLGAETSTIEQTGDAVGERDFFFLKPQVAVSWSRTTRTQTRVRVAREVAQLDFTDFVSSTVFQDDDVALGNPDLEPESTWVLQLSEEWRFGEIGVFRLTLFHDWISDVQDLLPITTEFEAPGNIGSGRRWGVELESTVPLDRVGIRNGRLDIDARLHNSAVTDPVTGETRVLSGDADVGKPLTLDVENRLSYAINFRQDFEETRIAWGSELRKRDDRFAYKVNELVRFNDGYELNFFVETTRWLGLRTKLELNNLLDFSQVRDRRIFFGERDLTPVEEREWQEVTDGRRIILSLSGSF